MKTGLFSKKVVLIILVMVILGLGITKSALGV